MFLEALMISLMRGTPLRDVHAGHPGKVERLQRHLRPGLADALRPKGAHRRTCTLR